MGCSEGLRRYMQGPKLSGCVSIALWGSTFPEQTREKLVVEDAFTQTPVHDERGCTVDVCGLGQGMRGGNSHINGWSLHIGLESLDVEPRFFRVVKENVLGDEIQFAHQAKMKIKILVRLVSGCNGRARGKYRLTAFYGKLDEREAGIFQVRDHKFPDHRHRRPAVWTIIIEKLDERVARVLRSKDECEMRIEESLRAKLQNGTLPRLFLVPLLLFLQLLAHRHQNLRVSEQVIVNPRVFQGPFSQTKSHGAQAQHQCCCCASKRANDCARSNTHVTSPR